jgi:putative transposase
VKNVLNCFPKQMAPAVKSDLDNIQHPGTRKEAEAALAVFSEKYEVKYPKGVACLIKDQDAMPAFFDFPAEHWGHLRASNPIESVFATVRHRTVRTKGALSPKNCKADGFYPN